MSDAEQPASPELGPLPSEKIVALRDVLEANSVPYAFGGAVALFYYRDPRSTIDIDVNIFLSPERRSEVDGLLSGLYPLDTEKFDADVGMTAQTRSLWGSTYIDLFFSNTEFHESMAQRVQRYPFLDTEINVLTAEDLLVCKVLYDRPKDWVDIEAVAKNRDLDAGYIRSWVGEFLPDDDPRLARVNGLLGR